MSIENAETVMSKEIAYWSSKSFSEMRSWSEEDGGLYQRRIGADTYGVEVNKLGQTSEFVHIAINISGPGIPMFKFLSHDIVFHADGRVDV